MTVEAKTAPQHEPLEVFRFFFGFSHFSTGYQSSLEADLRPESGDYTPEKSDLEPEKADLKPEREDGQIHG